MQREILFRGKRIDNGEWVEGYLIHPEFSEKSAYIGYLFATDNHDVDVTQVDPETVGQFTGLTDENGTKIFEGDVVSYYTNTIRAEYKDIHEVVFETRGGSGYFGIRISEIETWQFCLEVPAKLMEVVGNIHDNPEMVCWEEHNENR